MEKITIPAAFVLGLLYWRKSKAISIQVNPRIIFLPLDPELPSKPESQDKIAEELINHGIPREIADQIIAKAGEVADALYKLELSRWMLREASRALDERRISTKIYRSIIRRYMEEFVVTEEEIETKRAEFETILRTIVRKEPAKKI